MTLALNWEAAANIATVFAGISAPFLAWYGIWATSRQGSLAIEASVLVGMRERYASEEMREDLEALASWAKDNGDDFAGRWRDAKDRGEPDALRVNSARRRVKHHFLLPLDLYQEGFVSAAFVKAAAATDGVNIVRRIIAPLELALNPRSTAIGRITTLAQLCGVVGTGNVIDAHPGTLGDRRSIAVPRVKAVPPSQSSSNSPTNDSRP